MIAQLSHDLNSNRKIRFAHSMAINIDRNADETNFYWTLVKLYHKYYSPTIIPSNVNSENAPLSSSASAVKDCTRKKNPD